MSQVLNKFFCVAFLVSYVPFCLAMEEPSDNNDTTITTTENINLERPFTFRPDNQLRPDGSRPEYPQGTKKYPFWYEGTQPGHGDIPMFKPVREEYLEGSHGNPPFEPYTDKHFEPEDPKNSKSPIHRRPEKSNAPDDYDQSLRDLPKIPSVPQTGFNPPSHNNAMNDLADENRRKSAIQRGQNPVDPLTIPPGYGGTIGYDEETLDSAIGYNRRQANQGRRAMAAYRKTGQFKPPSVQPPLRSEQKPTQAQSTSSGNSSSSSSRSSSDIAHEKQKQVESSEIRVDFDGKFDGIRALKPQDAAPKKDTSLPDVPNQPSKRNEPTPPFKWSNPKPPNIPTKKALPDTPESSPGLDNIPWPEDRLEEQRAQRKAIRLAKKRTRQTIDLLVNDESIPSHVRDALQDIVKADGYWGWLTPDQMEERIQPIRREYRNILHDLNIQENLTAKQIEQRRALEDEFFTPEARKLFYEDALKEIDSERQHDIDKNISILNILDNKLQQLNDKYDARKEEYKRNALDTISEGYKKAYQNMQKQKEDFKRSQEERALQLQNQLDHQRHVQKRNKARKENDRVFKEQKTKPSDNQPSNPSDAFLTFADTETIIAPEAYDPSDLLTSIPDSTDLIPTLRTNEFLQHMGIDPNEFNSFKGGNAEQNKLHAEMATHLADIASNSAFFEDEHNAQIVKFYNDLVKTTHQLNHDSNITLAKAGFAVAKDLILAALWDYEHPIRELGSAMLHNITHPVEFCTETIDGIAQFLRAIGNSAKHSPMFGFSSPEETLAYNEAYNKSVHNFLDNWQQLPWQKKREIAAKAVADQMFLKTLLNLPHYLNKAATLNKHAKLIGTAKKAIIETKPLQPIRRTLIDMGHEEFNPAVLKMIDDLSLPSTFPALTPETRALTQASKSVASKISGEITMPLGFGRKAIPLLSDLSKTIQSFDAPALVPKRSKPYAECVKDLSDRIAAEKRMAEVLADVGEKEVSNNIIHYMDPEKRILKVVDNKVLRNIRSGSALKPDAHHAFPDIIDNYIENAESFDLMGDDGTMRPLYQVEGSLNGEPGIFEWIVDPNPKKGVTHRMFIKNGKITGKPNIRNHKKNKKNE